MGASALALLLLFTYLVIPGHAADAAPGDTHADDFESQDFTGTTGTLGWATSWIETGETDGETAGSIRVGTEPNCGTPSCLLLGRDSGPDATVERQVDLSGMASATLAFDYRRHRHPPGKGQVDLEVSDNGGADWYSLDSWSLGSSDATMLPASHDLTGFLAADTRIRFSVSGSTDDSHLNVDNLVITEGPAIPSGTPRMVISEFSHRGDDFVELYNAGDAAVDIDGYEVRLDGATDVTISQGGPAIVVPPGGHYLLVKPGTGLAASADQLLEAGLPSNVGIRLRDAASNLLDEVGIGSSSWSEGAPLPNQPSGTTQSYERLNGVSLGNCVDTDNNLADFVHNWGSANPQNMAAPSVPCGTPSVADHVVISEFRPEGPAGIHDEFVEIFNPTAVAVDVSGWIFHITEPSLFRDYHVIPAATILDPGEHYLLSDDDGPTPNDAQPYDIATNYAAAWADVVLKDESGTIVDVLGYGSTGNGQLYEGTALPPFEPGTADRSFERRNGGSTDTDDNLADFVYAFTASPQAGIPGPNRAPVFDQDLPDRSDSEGTQIALTAGATDPDGGTTLTYAATGLPQGVSIDATTGSISGALSPNSSGTHSVAITVSDDGVPVLQDTDVFTWTVTQGEVTYLVANSGGSNGGDDLLTVVDRADADPVSNEINIGSGTGTTNIEAVALQPGTNVLFAVQDDRLGTIDVTTGVFSPRPANAGAGNGSVGLTAFNNIEGLSFNPFTGELFGTHRRGTNEEDLLFRFDPTTGAHLPGAFGGDDYIPIANQGGYYHAADLAFDPTDAQLYLVHWDLSGNWSLATVDPMSGATATKGVAPDNIVSLAFDEAGRLYTSTETGGTENLYELNKLNASVISSIVIDNGSNYEAMAIAFPVEPNRSPSFNQDLADRSDPEGTVISLSAAAGDADIGDTLSYSATGLPPGLSIDPGSGLISGTIDFLAVGTHPVTVTVSDDGIPNLDDIDTFTWTVTDLNQPPVFDQDIGDQADAEGSAVSLSAAATDPDGGDLLTYAAIGLPPGLTIDDGSGLISGTIDYSASSGSPFAVTITATDNGVPNLGATPDTFFWTVANTNRPPTVGNPGAQTTPELAPFTLVITASDPDGDTPGFSDGGTLPAWAALVDNLDGTATILGTPGAGDSATTTVTITASDGGIPDLSDGAIFDLTVTNTNVPPTIINPGNQAVPEGAPFNLLISGADADGTTVSFTDGGSLPGWATLVDNGDNTATIAGTPGYTDAALTTVTITASDGSLSIDAVFDLTVTDTNRAPSIGSIGLQVVAEASALIPIVATASDPDGTIPGLSASGLPGWASFLDNGDGTGTVTGTPGYTDAALSTVTITASDGFLTDDAVFDLTVLDSNRAPILSPIADQTVPEAAAIPPVAISATDLDGTIPSLAATGLPAWATFVDNGDGTATITGTPSYTDATTTTVTVTVEDGGIPNLADSTVFDFIVTDTNRAPSVDPIANQTVAENDLLSFALTGSDPDGTSVGFTDNGTLPGWATLVDNGDGTAVISGTPGYSYSGVTTVTITASDGSLSGAAQFDLTVTDVNRSPLFDTDLPDRSDAEGSGISLSAAATDPDPDTLFYSVTGLPPGLLIDSGSGLISGTINYNAAAGSPYAVEITVTDDGTPNLDAVDTLTWTVVNLNRNPDFNQDLLDRTDSEGTTISITAGATDPDPDTLSYSATGLPPGVTIDPASGLISGTIAGGAAAASPHAVVVTVSDDGSPILSANDSFSWAVFNTPTNRPPVLEPIENTTADEQTTISLTATAADPDLDALTFSLINAPAGATIDPASGVFTWTPTESQGPATHTFTVAVTDDGSPSKTSSQPVRVVVTEVNRAPSLEPIGDQTSGEGDAIDLQVVASDPDLPTNVLTFAAVGLPPGVTIDTQSGRIAGTVDPDAAADSPYTVTIIVTDEGPRVLGSGETIVWAVTNTNQAAVLDPIAATAGDEQTEISFVATAIDPDGDAVVFGLVDPPAGAAIDPASGRFTWTPTERQGPVDHQVTISATDTGTPPLTSTQVVAVSVREVNAAPSISPLHDQRHRRGEPVNVTVVASDPDHPVTRLTFTATGLPQGLEIDPKSGVITGTVDLEAPASLGLAVEITVTDSGTPRLDATASIAWAVALVIDEPTERRKAVVIESTKGFETPTVVDEEPRPVRRGLVLMGGTVAATAGSLRWPFALLFVVLIAFATIGRIGLYPVLRRGNRYRGVIGFYDQELSFGLIAPDDGHQEVFVHAGAFPHGQRQSLRIGDRVEYRLLNGDHRPSAWGAKKLDPT